MALGVAMLTMPSHARADLPDEIQVYEDSVNKPGKFGLEIHTNHSFGGETQPTFPGEITSGDATRLTGEFSYGLGGGFEAGLYLDFVMPKDGSLQFAGPKLRLKWIGRQAPEGGVFHGINLELGRLKRTVDVGRPGGELRPILGFRGDNWVAIVNPILSFNLGQAAETRTPEFAPGMKIGRRIADGVSLGTELYRDVGPINRFRAGREQSTELYLVIDVDHGPLPLNFGVGRGWNGADPWIVKGIVEVPF